MSFSPLLFNIVLEVLADSVRNEKEMEGIQIRRDKIILFYFMTSTMYTIQKNQKIN